MGVRLQAISNMVDHGYSIADIGTDHGFLPISLVSSGKSPFAIAMDINEGPLQRAYEHITEAGLNDKIECRLSDGLDKLAEDEVDCAVIAGMGGDLISRIVRDYPEKIHSLILSPHTHSEIVRRTLREYKYRIIDEKMIVESGKYYVIIKSQKDRNYIPDTADDVYDYFGELLLKSKDMVLRQYLTDQKSKFNSIEQRKEYLDLVIRALSYYE